MTSITGTSGRADLAPNPYHQGTRRRTGEQVDIQFVHDLLTVLGDCRLLWLPNLTDTTTSTDKSRHAATITWSETLASFDAARARLGAGVAVAFNGTDEEGDVPDAGRYSFGDGASDQPFSVLVLTRPDVNNASMRILDKEESSSAEEWLLALSSSGYLTFQCVDESADASVGRIGNVAVGTDWVLLAGTYNGSAANTGVRTYKNATRNDTGNNGGGGYVAMENTAAKVHIASRYAAKEAFFNGTIALAAVAAKELSPDEMWTIKKLVNGYFGLDL